MRKKTIKVFLLLFLFSCAPQKEREEVVGYHEDGKLSYQYFLEEGKRHGEYKEYYPSGAIQIERTYDSDSIVSEKIIDINGKVLVNYVKKEGRYYGLLGSSSCMSVFPTLEEKDESTH